MPIFNQLQNFCSSRFFNNNTLDNFTEILLVGQFIHAVNQYLDGDTQEAAVTFKRTLCITIAHYFLNILISQLEHCSTSKLKPTVFHHK